METSNAETGSSAIIILGFVASALAMAILCRWPPLNSWGNLSAKFGFKPTKTNLTEIGRTCENHTNIIIYSIQKKDSKYSIKLKGKSNGNFYLTYFSKRKMKRLICPSFEGENIVELPL